MNVTEHVQQLSPTRRALLAAGTVTLGLSMALSIAPAFAARTGNSGTVKIHDVTTGVDVPDNDPQVCAFTIVFLGFDAGASGTWEINHQPSAAGDPVLDGTFTADASGDSETEPINLPAGHYKLDLSLNGGNPKQKSIIVKDTCGPAGSGGGDPATTPDPDPSQPAASEPAASEPAASDPGGDASPDPDPSQPAASEPAASEPAASEPAASEPASSQPAASDPGADPSSDPGTTSPGDPGTTTDPTAGNPSGEAGQSPEGDVKAITGSGNATASLPNTSVDPQPIGIAPLLTVLGLLLIVAAHPFIRRSAHADRA